MTDEIDACIARYQVWRQKNSDTLAAFDEMGCPLPPLHTYRPHDDDDWLLDALDIITGWCSPHMLLDD